MRRVASHITNVVLFALHIPHASAQAPRVVHETEAQWKAARPLAVAVERKWCSDENEAGCDYKGLSHALSLTNGGVVMTSFNGPINEFGANGKFVRARGRKGQGPGEYGFVATLSAAPDGAISWFDNSQMRVASVGADGKPGAIQRIPMPQTTFNFWVTNGELIAFDIPYGAESDTVVATYHTVPAVRAAAGAKQTPARELARVKTIAMFRPGANGFVPPPPFAARVVSDVGPAGDIAHSNGATYQFDVFPIAGAPWHLVIDAPTRRVTNAEHDSVVASALKRMNAANVASLPPALRRNYEINIPFHAPVEDVHILRDGTIWIRPVALRAATAARWDIFARNGQRIGAASLPLTARVQDGTRDWILTIEENADDTPFVVRYRVGK